MPRYEQPLNSKQIANKRLLAALKREYGDDTLAYHREVRAQCIDPHNKMTHLYRRFFEEFKPLK